MILEMSQMTAFLRLQGVGASCPNLYAYCANNPVIYYDPSEYGLCPNGKTYPAKKKNLFRI